MKNKKTVYVLLPAVAIIWGIVIYRVFSGLHSSNENYKMNTNFNTSVNTNSSVLDTFSISANYRDPFLGRMISVNANSIQKNETPKVEKVIQQIKWPTIIYNGMIKNQKSKKELALVQIGGKDNIMKAGETAEGIKIQKIYKDSIEVVFEKEKKAVRK